MGKKIKNFHLPMHLCTGTDDLRIAMRHVYFEKGYMYATDAHIAVRAMVSAFSDFDEKEIALLDGKFISREKFKRIFASSLVQVIDEGILCCQYNILYKWERDTGMKYPNIDAVLRPRLDVDEAEAEAVKKIGLNPDFLQTISRTLMHREKLSYLSPILYFNGTKKPIMLLHPHHKKSELAGILMPVNIND